MHDEKRKPEAAKQRAFEDFHATGSELFGGHHVVDAPAPHSLSVWNDLNQSLETFAYDKLILATGARERFLPFPGWTLPGVVGAGGMHCHSRRLVEKLRDDPPG